MDSVTSSLGVLCLLAAALYGCSTARPLSPPEQFAYEPSLAVAGDRIAIAWNGGPAGQNAIFARWADARGRPSGPPLQLSSRGAAYEPDLQLFDGDLIVAWYEKDAQGVLAAWVGRFDSRGASVWQRSLSVPGHAARNPVIRLGGSDIHVAWLESSPGEAPRVRAAVVGVDGEDRGIARDVGEASNDTWNLNAALADDGTFYVAYDARLGTRAKELRLARISTGAASSYALGEDDGFDSVYPDIALAHERVAVTWFDQRDGNAEVYLFVGRIDELLKGTQPAARRVTATPGESIGAYVQWNGERVGLAWCDDSEGQNEIWRQYFDARGAPSSAAHRVTDNRTDSLIPALRAFRSGFALVWTERLATAAPGDGATLSSRTMLQLLP
jgi:hypothetical protein